MIKEPRDLFDGSITVRDVAGRPSTIAWHEAEAGAGWTYIGWIVVDGESGDRIALASNMIEATWESPDGTLTALDGALDPFMEASLKQGL